MQGEIMNRLQVAMKYSVKENNIALLAQGLRKVPLFKSNETKGFKRVFYRLPRLGDFSSQFKAHLLQLCTEY